MVYHPYLHKPPAPRSQINIGARTLVDIRRRLRELDQKHPPTMTTADRKEAAKLRMFLHLSQVGGEHDV